MVTRTNMIYMTAANRDEARAIGRVLVESRLVACVNIIDGMTSLYWWEGKVQDDTEAVIIAKTTESLVPSVIEKVKSLHSYTCPCVVSLPLLDGNKDYLNWLVEETAPR
ncbi:MAG: divalent-cation tolerance protein CutA [bacterium]|nr:divalent-cation tolerance protein CutA [bacterium]